jgi:hypothetical protein
MERTHIHIDRLWAGAPKWAVVSSVSRPQRAGKLGTGRHLYCQPLWIIVALTVLSIIGGLGLGQIQPCGRKAGLIQFDAISEWNLDGTRSGNVAVFTRYWVCEDYYAVSVVWTEPHGSGVNMKTAIVFSDATGFRMNNELFPDQVNTNRRYPKPLGERGPFHWGAGFYGGSEMRFAEAQALARRVYVSDFQSARRPTSDVGSVVDVNVPKDPDDVIRKLARLKVWAADDRIESMQLFDKRQQLLTNVRYEYERGAGPARVSMLVAELPVRPEKLAVDAHMTRTTPDGNAMTYKVPDVNHLSHKGGRTCTVTYKDVTLGDTVLRLPVQVRVQRSDNEQLLRSAKLMNFRRVDLDKAGVWDAAKTFGGLGSEYATWNELVNKFLYHDPNLGAPPVDPNDLAFLRKLVAKYPVWEEPPRPRPPERERRGPASVENGMQGSAKGRVDELRQARRREQEEWDEQTKTWREQVAKMPKPPQKEIEPNDARLIRQLRIHYRERFSNITGQVPEDELELWNLNNKLRDILEYHRVAPLPEDRRPEPDDSDLKLIRQLKEHYETLILQDDQGLGGRLKALHALTRLDLMAEDYDALEQHTVCYLQMLRDAGLNAMYMGGGHGYINDLIQAGEYEKADRLIGQWAGGSAATNDADDIYRFCDSGLGGRKSPWIAVQVLDRFLKRPGLSPVEKYEGLALRAIAFDKIDKLLADPNAATDEARGAQVRWILKNTTRAAVARMVVPAVGQAVSAWEALGPARFAEARPYSTDGMAPSRQNLMEAPDATRLQETSALPDQIVRQRISQRTGPAPRSRPPGGPGRSDDRSSLEGGRMRSLDGG